MFSFPAVCECIIVCVPKQQLWYAGFIGSCKAIILRAAPARLTASPPWHWVEAMLLSWIILLDVSAFVVILLDFPRWALSQSGQEQFDRQQTPEGFFFFLIKETMRSPCLTAKSQSNVKLQNEQTKKTSNELSLETLNPDFLPH